MKWQVVQQVDYMIDELFCPQTTAEEKTLDEMLTKILRQTLTGRKQTDILLRALRIFDDYHNRNRPMICRQKSLEMKHNKLRNLVTYIMSFSREQIKMLIKIGFCMSWSEVTYPKNPELLTRFGICHGNTDPDNTHVTHHVPSTQEVDSQSLVLQNILSKLPVPKMITVCRSFRDGYVPKEHFKQIETNIISAIKHGFTRFQDVLYDRFLLGGPNGWFERFR